MRLLPKMSQKLSSSFFFFELQFAADGTLKKKKNVFTLLRGGTYSVVHFSFIRIISLLRSETLVNLPAFKLGSSHDKTPLSCFFSAFFSLYPPSRSLLTLHRWTWASCVSSQL